MFPTRLVCTIILGVILGASLFLIGPCRRQVPEKQQPAAFELRKDEKARVEVNTRRREVSYVVRRPDGTLETKVVREVRHATVVVKDKGEIRVTARWWGFCLEPGLALAIHRGVRPAVDLRFLYAGAWGVESGLFYSQHLHLYVAGSYDLTRIKLANTGLWAGMTLKQEIVGGIRVSF